MVRSKGCKPSLHTLEIIFDLSSKDKHFSCYTRVEKIARYFYDANAVDLLVQKYPTPEEGDASGTSILFTNIATEETAKVLANTAEKAEEKSN